MEEPLQVAERGLTGKVDPETELRTETSSLDTTTVKTEDSSSTGLQPTAPEFRLSDARSSTAARMEAGAGGLVTGGVEEAMVTETTGSGGAVGIAGTTRTIHPSRYDGRTAWDAYKTQFEMLANLNGWNGVEKATYLAINLKGAALTVLSNLPTQSRSDYTALTAALDSRFGVAHQAKLNRTCLRNRRR